jgi:hypothetical protein
MHGTNSHRTPAFGPSSTSIPTPLWQDAFLEYSKEAGPMADIGSSIAAKAAMRVHGEEKLFADNLAAQMLV